MSAERRSALMSRIKGKNTAPEVFVRKYLWRAGMRYRLHTSGLPGKPDLVLKRWDAVVFVNGCFWHRHSGCPLFRLPKTRSEFWDQKLRANQIRDLKAIAELSGAGWRVCVVWECALRAAPEQSCSHLVDWIRRGDTNAALEAVGQSAQLHPLAPHA
ncbi:MAG: very short patch repair endonuclease [Polynucleobacter sp.]|nr:very short patch repair endonuclease [Polynucleobacter sp.]